VCCVGWGGGGGGGGLVLLWWCSVDEELLEDQPLNPVHFKDRGLVAGVMQLGGEEVIQSHPHEESRRELARYYEAQKVTDCVASVVVPLCAPAPNITICHSRRLRLPPRRYLTTRATGGARPTTPEALRHFR